MIPRKGYIPVEAKFPLLGLNTAHPSTAIGEAYSPDVLNVDFEEGIVRKRKGYTQAGSDLGDGCPVIGIVEYENLSGTKYLLAITTKHRYLYDDTSDEFYIMGSELDDAEAIGGSDWVGGGDVTVALDSVDYKRGSSSVKFTVGSGAGTGKLAYTNTVNTSDISSNSHVGFWIKSSIDLDENDLELVVSQSSDGDKTGTYETLQIPAVPADTWTYVSIEMSSSPPSAVASLGLYQAVDKGAFVLKLDDIRAFYEWTGDEDDILDWTRYVGTDDGANAEAILYMTNGKDTPVYWKGSGDVSKVIPGTHAPSDFVTCKTVASYYDRLILGNVTTTDTQYEQGIFYNNIGDFRDWSTAEVTGSTNMRMLEGEILKLLQLGDMLIVYSDNSIGSIVYVGGDTLFQYSSRVNNVRLASPRTVVNIGPYHLYATRDNFFFFDGSRSVWPIGSLVHSSYRNEVNQQALSRAFAYNDNPNKRAFFAFPRENAALPYVVYVVEYDIHNPQRNVWTRHLYTDTLFSLGEFSQSSGMGEKTWDSKWASETTWEDVDGTWNIATIREAFSKIVAGSTDGRCFIFSGVETKDATEPFEGYFDTRDFTIPDVYTSEKARWVSLEIEAKGTGVDVEYSTDQGSSWTTVGSLDSLNESIWTRNELFFDTVSRYIRFRFKSTNHYFHLRWIRVWLMPLGY